jgi:twinkle protein
MIQHADAYERIASKSVLHKTIRMACPFCSDSRTAKNQSIPVLSVDNLGDRIVYKCHHCDESGAFSTREKKEWKSNLKESETVSKPVMMSDYSNALLAYFRGRGISEQTLANEGVTECKQYMRDAGKEVPAFAVPYKSEGRPTKLKIRSYPEKMFCWSGGGAETFLNIDSINVEEPVYIVEGEIDYLTCIEYGFTNVVSVPNGAPMKVTNNAVDPTEDGKFKYIAASMDKLKLVKKFIIATDGDPAGTAMAEELARRLGRSRCWRVTFPADKDKKDANAYLQSEGRSSLIDLLNRPVAWPIAGLFDASKYVEDVRSYYDRGVLPAESTGYEAVDELYRVAPGQLTLVTGIPGSGKSEFVDQIMVNLAVKKDWKFAICSFENQPDYHIIKLAEKYARLSFFASGRRMSPEVRDEALKFITEHFIFIEQSGDVRANIDSILERATAAVGRMGVRGLVIDPYNYLEKKAEGGSETEQAGVILSKTRQFCIANSVHTWFIAHPQKLMRDSSGNVYVPRGYDVSGSANFFNMPDMGITLHRRENHVEFHNWKTRFKWWGQVGMAKLSYDKEISCYEPFKEGQDSEEWSKDF